MNFSGFWRVRSDRPENVALTSGQPVRMIRSGDSEMIVLGHCLASDDVLADGLRTVRTTRRFDPVVTEWPGCYSLAIFLPDELVLLSDPVGQFPLYTATTSGGTWFGSSATELAGRVRAAVDPSRVAMSIACVDVLDVSDNRTMFHGVGRLPLGGVTTVGPDGISVRSRRPLAVDENMTLADAAERLRWALLTAVAARAEIAQEITGDFSGGIDSSTLMFLSLRTGADVSGFTFHHTSDEVEDDLSWALRFAHLAPELKHRLVPVRDDDLPYQKLVASVEQPHPSAFFVGPLRARLGSAVEQGSTLHLVGEGGDLVVGAPPAYLADLARRGEMTALWRHCRRWGRVRQCSPLALLRRAVAMAGTSRRQALKALAATIARGVPRDGQPPWHLDAVGYWDAPHGHWLTRSARADFAGHVRALADEPQETAGVGDAVTLSQLRTQLMTERAVRDVGEELGVAVHAPYLDSAVIRACLALPAHRRADPVVVRPLLRSALTGLVPDVVLNRPTKGKYTRNSYLGLRRAAPALRGLLAEPVAADHGILDPVPVRAVLERAIQGLPVPRRAFNQVIAVELWLRDISRKGAAS